MSIKTKEIVEAAVFYMHGFRMESYADKYWTFTGSQEESAKLGLDLINKQVKVEPLEFMDAIRRVKSFSNGSNREI